MDRFEPELAPAQSVGFSAERLARIAGVLGADARAGRIAGAVSLIARDGAVVHCAAVGQRDPATGAAMTVDSIFRIYSMTKPVTSLAIMMLAEEGRLLLSDPLSRFIPAFAGLRVGAGGEPMRREPTVQDLLRHTSGFVYGHYGETAVHHAYREAAIGLRGDDNATFVEKLARVPLAFQPGESFEYGVSTDVLGRIVEIVSGLPLDRFFAERIFGPLGMVDSGFDVPADRHHRIAQPGVDPVTGEVPVLNDVTRPVAYKSGGGGGVSTAADYLRLCRLFLGGGAVGDVRLVAPKTMALMMADHMGTIGRGANYLPGPGYGFGLGFAVRLGAGVAPIPGSAGDCYWSGVGGTYFWIDPAERLIAILMLQAPSQRQYYRQLFRNLVYQALVG
ncbi:serine hydrolase domain-containing protein [Stella sp.]|uniref:serine hydrolase domain-containing protein n=1 Tax=Stella sp. TaxID=2912054 RepID=UPI0035B1AB24